MIYGRKSRTPEADFNSVIAIGRSWSGHCSVHRSDRCGGGDVSKRIASALVGQPRVIMTRYARGPINALKGRLSSHKASSNGVPCSVTVAPESALWNKAGVLTVEKTWELQSPIMRGMCR